MNKSDAIGKLSGALAKVQAVIKGAIKDSANPFFHSQYADLTSVWEACRKPLSDNDLSVIQGGVIIDGAAYLETMLTHSSGEWISGLMPLRPSKDDPQGLVAATTYMRRAGLAAIVGVAPADDDGNTASGKPAVNAQAAADYVGKQKIAGFSEKHDALKKEMVARPKASPPELKQEEQVIRGILSYISKEMPTKTGKPFVSIEVGAHKMNIFDTNMFQGEDAPMRKFMDKEVNVIVEKKGQYLNFVAMELADIQTGLEEGPPLTNEDIPF